MLIYNIVTAICFTLLAGFGVWFLISLLCKKHSERIEFVRGFKNGKIAIIYVISIPLYLIGHLHAGKDAMEAFFSAINKVINTVVLKYDTATIKALMDANHFYMVTVYFCFIMIAFNALLFTFSLLGQHIWLFFKGLKFRYSHRDKLILVGKNDGNFALYKSAKKRYARVLFDRISDASGVELFSKQIYYKNVASEEAVAEKIFTWKKFSIKDYCVIINTGDESKNINICQHLVAMLEKLDDAGRDRYFHSIKIYVYGDPRYAAIYEDIVSSAFGVLHYVNKYQQIAMDFVEHYPLTQFMDEKQIDYKTSLIKKDVEINVFLIGFGKTNQQIFLTSVANNQFLTAADDGGDPVLKKVNYLIFDKQRAENNKNLNHSYYRFRNETMGADQDEYLPFPEIPAHEVYYKLDINDSHFYRRIRERAMRSPNDANYVVIAFGSDLENVDMAQKLVEKRREWNLDNLIIFVKVRNWTKEQTMLEDEGCYFIGNERRVVYDIEEVTGDRIYRMAHMRNEIYDVEYDITHSYVKEITDEYLAAKKAESNKTWYTEKTQLERESNIYGCLSLRSKLHLMGLDYCPIAGDDKRPALSEEEYLKHYAGKDLPNFNHYTLKANGKNVAYYGLTFADGRRKNMAIHEHQRWNSFMISKGIVPATKDLILHEKVMKKGELKYSDGKNYKMRRHGNITTFEGLVEFRKMIAERDKTDELVKDVIKYDYQILDDAYWMLKQNGMKIVRKEK